MDIAQSNFISIKVLVDGRPVTALVDTGATRSFISKPLALDLGLVENGVSSGYGLTAAISGASYLAQSINIDGFGFETLTLGSYSSANMAGMIPTEVPLIIGRDILDRLVVEIDFPNSRIRFASRTSNADRRGFERLQLHDNSAGVPSFDVHFGNAAAVLAAIDFGSNVVCSMYERYAIDAGLLAGRRTSTTVTLGIEGPVESLVYTAPAIEVGGVTLRDVPVAVLRQWALPAPVNLGWPMFAAFDTVLELGRSEMWFRANDEYLKRPFPKDRLGLGAMRLSDRLRILHVAQNSPAAVAGLAPGDEVVAINGKAVDATFPPAGERQGYKPPGTPLDLKLRTGQRVHLILADYF